MPWRTVSAAKAGVANGTPPRTPSEVRASPNWRRVISAFGRVIADPLEGRTDMGNLLRCERGENPLRRQWQLLDADAGRRRHRVGDRRRHPHDAGLAHAFGAKRPARFGLFHYDGLDLQWDIERSRYLVIHHRRIGEAAVVPDQFLAQGIAEPLHKTPLDLAFNGQRVDGLAHAMREPRRHRIDLSGVRVDLDLHNLRTKHVNAEIRERKSDHACALQIERLAIVNKGVLADQRAADPIMCAQRY